MIKILQYGKGNFLRTFADVYFDTLNKENLGKYGVYIVKPIKAGSIDAFKEQDNNYHVILRGVKEGPPVENVYEINSVCDVIDPFVEKEKYYALATDVDLKMIVSNTTEAGIYFNETDRFDDFENITYPAKLTLFLYERFKSGLSGVCILPVELIENNADKLFECVEKYITLWNLPCEFRCWNAEQNNYCNTLVDRIVSGYPRDKETEDRLTSLIGNKDKLMAIGEPFGLWAIEDKGNVSDYIVQGKHNVEVVLTDDIDYYKKRKVRVLNGSHTNLVALGLALGKQTVYDCMTSVKISNFVKRTLDEEIIPFVSNNLFGTKKFANSVIERFYNPYLNHQLSSIFLNSISKWRARNLPSFNDYYKANSVVAPMHTIGFSYLMAIYSSVVKTSDGRFEVKLPSGKIEIKDDKEYLEYFASNGSISEFMRRDSVWGEDLSQYNGFCEQVEENVRRIKEGICLI